jgi:phage gp46-like protein
MGQNWKFDPSKRDYVLDKGSPVPTDRIEEAAYFILTIPKGRWLYGSPTQGSELFLFNNAKRVPNTEKLFSARVVEALERQLVEPGRAREVSVFNLESSRFGTSNQVDVVPAESNISSQVKVRPV